MVARKGSLKRVLGKKGESPGKSLWGRLFINFSISMLIVGLSGYLFELLFDGKWQGHLLIGIPASVISSVSVTFFMDMKESLVEAMREHSIPASAFIPVIFPFSLVGFAVQFLLAEAVAHFSQPSMPPHMLRVGENLVVFQDVRVIDSNSVVLKRAAFIEGEKINDVGNVRIDVPSGIFYVSWKDSFIDLGTALMKGDKYGLDTVSILHNFVMRLSCYLLMFLLTPVALVIALKGRKYREPFHNFFHRLILLTVSLICSGFLFQAMVSLFSLVYLPFSTPLGSLGALLGALVLSMVLVLYLTSKYKPA